MSEWLNSLTTLQNVFLYMAIPATVIVILQLILMLFGIGEGLSGGAHDVGDCHDGHDSHSHDDGLKLITVRGVVTFVAIMGWAGVALLSFNIPVIVSVILAIAMGFGAFVLTAYILKWSMNMQESGNIELVNAVGCSAEVYLTIPASGQGSGKINVTLQGRYCEFTAITHNEQAIKFGEKVTVTSIMDDNTLIVAPIIVD